jgi:hypothetical protein
MSLQQNIHPAKAHSHVEVLFDEFPGGQPNHSDGQLDAEPHLQCNHATNGHQTDSDAFESGATTFNLKFVGAYI